MAAAAAACFRQTIFRRGDHPINLDGYNTRIIEGNTDGPDTHADLITYISTARTMRPEK